LKRTALLVVALMGVVSAHAQVDLYNDLSDTTYTQGNGDWDGGVNQLGSNAGLQCGQVFTSTINGSVTSVEGMYVGFTATPTYNGALVQIFNFSGGTVGSLVGQAQVSGNLAVPGADPVFTSYYRYDLTANVNIAGLVSGNQYFATLQGQGPDWAYLLRNGDGNLTTFGRDYSSFGYAGGYGTTTWTEMAALNLGYSSGDSLMRIAGTPVPEPASMAALGLGVAALIRRRRR